tara:strand:+ start:221 stop:871 length:651 start_codon:yes stop_codon:yes gene_type:complete
MLGLMIIILGCSLIIYVTSKDVLYWLYQWLKTKFYYVYYSKQGLDFWPQQTAYHNNENPLYITSPFGELAPYLKTLDAIHTKTFIDCGCGKGNILMEAGQFPFKALAGIELDPNMMAICKTNLETLRLQAKTTLYCGSVNDYEQTIAQFDIIYCYGVYQKDALESLCHNIKNQPVSKILIYRNLSDSSPLYNAGFKLTKLFKKSNLADYTLWVFRN